MLIKSYNPAKAKTLNHTHICNGCDLCITKTYNWLKYTTTAFNIFDAMTNIQVNDIIEWQQKVVKAELDLQLKYNQISRSIYNKTLKQYEIFLEYQNHFYNKEELKFYIWQRDKEDSTILNSPPLSSQLLQDHNTSRNHIWINREAIRSITNYTFNPIPNWDELKRPVYIEWQHMLLEDEHDLVIVNWSRQMWKSFTISQKLIECSFIPNNDTLVWAFLVSTTNVIRNYCQKLIRKFPEGTFEYRAWERYLINLKTLTKIYFRTLWDDAQNILGLTLKRVIVDEAQLISQFVFEEVLEPTLSTTGGQMIMIWTPWRKRSGYMFDKITQYKKWMLPDASFYEVDVTKNPFIAPKKRAYIMANKHDYAIRRQWFCEWSDGSDWLFPFKKCFKVPENTSQWYLVMGIDPARINDRSSYDLNYVYEWKAYSLYSWFVPDVFKKDWWLQAKFYVDMIKTFKDNPNFYIGMDITWVWDWVLKVFRDAWLPIKYTIRYTSSWSEPDKKESINFKVGKSYLINTAVDMMQEWSYEIYEPTNKDLLEEISYAVEERDNRWLIKMDTTFFDDTINAMMVSLFFIKQRNFIERSLERTPTYYSSWVQYVDAIEWLWIPEEEASHVW